MELKVGDIIRIKSKEELLALKKSGENKLDIYDEMLNFCGIVVTVGYVNHVYRGDSSTCYTYVEYLGHKFYFSDDMVDIVTVGTAERICTGANTTVGDSVIINGEEYVKKSSIKPEPKAKYSLGQKLVATVMSVKHFKTGFVYVVKVGNTKFSVQEKNMEE